MACLYKWLGNLTWWEMEPITMSLPGRTCFDWYQMKYMCNCTTKWDQLFWIGISSTFPNITNLISSSKYPLCAYVSFFNIMLVNIWNLLKISQLGFCIMGRISYLSFVASMLIYIRVLWCWRLGVRNNKFEL